MAKWFVWMRTSEENALQMKPCSFSVTSLKRLVRLQSCEKAMGWCTAQCKMLLFCMKTTKKEPHNFELQ